MQRLVAEGANAAQIEYWNGPAADRWVKDADTQDVMLGELGTAAIDACQIEAGQAVLDIGCGCGSTTLSMAARVGAGGRVLGIDISTPMLEVARARLRERGLDHVAFENRDVATYPFEPASFDRAFSRFGVMFFTDPVAAFRNIRSALKAGGRLAFVCWQAQHQNQWMEIPLRVAFRHVPPPPPPPPNEPGPTAFADPDRVRSILGNSGFGRIEVEPLEQPLMLGSDTRHAVERLMQVGPTGRLLRDADDKTKDAVAADLQDELSTFATDSGVKMVGRVWLVRAVAG
jgi:SAM-dependent methyltransferase